MATGRDDCSGVRWIFWVAASLFAACATPVGKDSTYPADWPALIAEGEECRGIEGTFENRGVLVERSGQGRTVWLTGELPFMGNEAPGDPRLASRSAMAACEFATLRLETTPWRALIGPDTKHWKLLVSPARASGTSADTLPGPCRQFQLPEGLGFPFEGRATLFAACSHNVFGMTNVTAPKVPIGEGQPFWHLSVAADGSLVIRYSEATATGHRTVGWSRFERRP